MSKLKNFVVMDDADRWSVSLRQSTRDAVDAYVGFFAKAHGVPLEKVGKSELIEQMLRAFMADDKAFIAAYPAAKKLAD